MAEEMVPKAVVDTLMQQVAALQATVDRLTSTIEEKDRIKLIFVDSFILHHRKLSPSMIISTLTFI